MTLFDLLPEIAEEIAGTPKELFRQRMREFMERNPPPPGAYKELSDEEVERARAARKDPEGFKCSAMVGAMLNLH